MRVIAITPTADRPKAFALSERWMKRQTRQPDSWVISDGGKVPAEPTTVPTRHVTKYVEDVHLNFVGNVLRGLACARGADAVLFWEDDDWYGPRHIEDCVARLESGAMIVGSIQQRYYNVKSREWNQFRNAGSCFCQTAISTALTPLLFQAAAMAISEDSAGIDGRLWALAREAGVKEDNFEGPGHVLGIKGVEGKLGIGMGHRPDSQFTPDPGLDKLREWIGDDAEVYQEFQSKEGKPWR